MKLTSGTTGSAYIIKLKESLSEVPRYELQRQKVAYTRLKQFKKLQVKRHQLRACVAVIVSARVQDTNNTVAAALSRSTID
jgi:hypothetical protein